ncbi:MAG: C39 family peptidase [Coriobacteriia bacterium]|nr:C39 family peptidase [Coriobacteriia bacterium]
MNRTEASKDLSEQERFRGLNKGPQEKRRHRKWPWVLSLSLLFIVVVGGFAVAALYRADPANYVYHSEGYGFHLTRGKDSKIEATLISNDTTAPVVAQVQAVYRTGSFWADAKSWIKNDSHAYPVTRVSGLSSKGSPIDLSELATDTAVALDGQAIRYQTSGYSLVATQTAGVLQVQAASVENANVLPVQLFKDFSGHPLKVELSVGFEAKLLDEVIGIAATGVQRSSDYDVLVQRISQLVKPYAAVMDKATTGSIQSEKAQLRGKQDDLRDREGVLLNVPVISQRPVFIAGCEAASTAMLITYAGHPMSTADVIAVMPYSGNPAKGYVGNPRTWDGYTIYPSAMKSVVQKYLGTGIDLTDCGMDTIHEYLRAGKPVVCWLGPGALPGISPHCVCVTGYKDDTIFYNDPYLNTKNRAVSEDTFAGWMAEFGNRAMSY